MGRWDELFGDLEGQLDAAESADLEAEVAALQVAAWGRTSWLDRLRAARGRAVDLRLCDGSVVRGVLESLGPDWVLVAGPDEVLVPAAAVAELVGLPARAEPETSAVVGRLGLAAALRRLAGGAEPVLLSRVGRPPLRCRLLRVGRDHIDVVPADDDHADSAKDAVRTLPYASLVSLRRL